MKKTVMLCLLSFTLISMLKSQDINISIHQDLINWLEKIPRGSEDKFGFNSREEFKSSSTGKPYEIYTLSSSYFSDEINQDSNYLTKSSELRVPIVVRNENRALLTVIKSDSDWQIVDLGATTLAKELGNFKIINGLDLSKDLKIIRIYQLNSDFLTLDDISAAPGKLFLYPMKSALINIPEITEIAKGSMTLKTLNKLVEEKKINFY